MIDQNLFADLLEHAESEILDFKARNYDLGNYEKKIDLIKDILAMANTPRDEPARIIVGVKRLPDGSNELIGLDHDIDEADFQSQFPERTSPVPRVTYELVSFQEKRFAVISVFPERNGPYVALKDWGRRLLRNIVYFRRGSKNDEATPVDYRRILAWCNGDDGLIATDVPSAPASDAWRSICLTVQDFPADGRYVLITNRREHRLEPALDALALVPWSVVIDFDPSSENGGLIATLEPGMREQRPIHRVLRSDRPNINVARSVHWFFARGIVGRKDTVANDNYKEWLKVYRREIDKQVEILAGQLLPSVTYCIAIWDGQLSSGFLKATLESAFSSFGDRFQVALITPDVTDLREIAEALEVEPIHIVPHQFYQGIRAMWGQRYPSDQGDLVIPSSSGAPIPISADQQRWLEEELQVVSLHDGRCRPDGFDGAWPFLKGADPTWYELALHLDIDRDTTPRIKRAVQDDLERRRTTRVNLYHEPGAGGTTVAKRLAWDLHESTPTVILNRVTPLQTAERIYRLASESALSVLVVVDGAQVAERELDVLFEELRSRNVPVVVLQVLRRFKKQDESKRSFWLCEQLGDTEAQKFFDSYLRERPSRRDRLLAVMRLGECRQRSAFYFGLEAFQSEFIGLNAYVERRIYGLSDPQRKILQFLAIAYHYGQRALPEQAFAKTIGLPRNKTFRLQQALSNETLEMLVHTTVGEWRVAHELIARTLLEHLLSPQAVDRDRLWKQNLSRAAIEFAEFCLDEGPVTSNAMLDAVRRVFIYRDNADVIGTERSATQRFAQIIDEIPVQEGQLEVFRALVALFPDEAHFWSHMGRFCALKLHDYPEALKCVERAIALEPSDSVLHHMHGMVLRQQLLHAIEQPESLENLITIAKSSSAAFTQSRVLNPDNEHGYVSEIQMLTRLLDSAARSSSEGVIEVLRRPGIDPFLREALDRAEDLLAQLRNRRQGEELGPYEQDCRAKLDSLYGHHDRALQTLDSMLTRNDVFRPPVRRQIVWTQYVRRGRNWGGLLPNEIDRVVSLLEQNLQEEPAADVNFRLWLQAIRRERSTTRTLESVIERVAYWKANSGSLEAVFYLYVLHSLLAMDGSSTALDDAERHLEECRKLAFNRRNRSRSLEWLGVANGIRALVPGSELGEWDREADFWEKAAALTRADGRISKIRGPQAGEIQLESGLKAFFVPAKGSFAVGRSENLLVQFYLGFSYDGLRAWDVKPI